MRVTAAREVQSTRARPPAAATRPAHLLGRGLGPGRVPRLGEVPGDVEHRLLAEVERRLDLEVHVAEPGAGLLPSSSPPRSASADAATGPAAAARIEPEPPGERGEARAAAERRRHQDHRRPPEEAVGERLGDADRREVQDRPPSRHATSSTRAAPAAGAAPRAVTRRAAATWAAAVGSADASIAALAVASRSARRADARRRARRRSGRPGRRARRARARARRRPRRPGRCRPGPRRRCRAGTRAGGDPSAETSRPNAPVATSGSAWASSNTTTSCSGSTLPDEARCAQ